MKTRIDTPHSRCKAGVARGDITPPVGIYHRMWGAALHDRATGVHRPLTATALYLESLCGTAKLLVIGMDHCILDGAEIEKIRTGIACIAPSDIAVSLSHTHGSGWMSRTRSAFPGGDLIAPYLDQLVETCIALTREAIAKAAPATITYGTGRCSLAAHRDTWDETAKQFVCGFNTEGPADDTLLVARISGSAGTLATVVNYACHPTTLAWENTLISPDYVGAMREVVERETLAPCLFLQGASGDLGPREGYVGDVHVAESNGRQLGFAALATLEAMGLPGKYFAYTGPVVSGAILGTWAYHKLTTTEIAAHETWRAHSVEIALPYRLSLPTVDETKAELAKWLAEETLARAANNENRVSECRARAEQMTRQLTRLAAMPPGRAYPYRVWLFRVGNAVWVFCPGELYQVFQTTLRSRFPQFAVMIATVTNDWQPGYLPTANSYGYGIYQEIIAAVAPGSLETVIEEVTRAIRTIAEES